MGETHTIDVAVAGFGFRFRASCGARDLIASRFRTFLAREPLDQIEDVTEIEVELDDATFAATLLPGTSADVEVLLEVRAGKLRIPTGALLRDDFVLVVREGVLVRQKVDAGLRNWAFAEIRDGLEPGDRVVTSLDRAEARAGARVRVEEEETER